MEQELIKYIEKLAKEPGNDNVLAAWYLIATCSLCSCNQGPMIIYVYRAAIAPYSEDAVSRRLILRRIKEALLKTSVVYGLPRLLNGFYPLIKSIPDEESQDYEAVRHDLKNPYDLRERGEWYMAKTFGKSALDTMFGTLDKYHQDLRKLVIDYIYGVLHSELSVLDPLTTSQITLGSLLPIECMTEVAWHMRGLINNGGSVETVQKTLGIAKEICKVTGVQLRNQVPDVEKVLGRKDIVSESIKEETEGRG